MNTIKTTYRDIAKMLVKAMPVEGQDYYGKVEQYIDTIRAMSQESKVALKSAYIFSRKVPKQEHEDMFQDLALAILKARTKDERLAYSIARCDWRNWWAKYRIRQHTSLDSVIEDNKGNPIILAETIVGEVEFERKMDGELDAQRIWDILPDDIKPLIEKRLEGKPLTAPRKKGRPKVDVILDNTERSRLNRWIKKEGYKILLDYAT